MMYGNWNFNFRDYLLLIVLICIFLIGIFYTVKDIVNLFI